MVLTVLWGLPLGSMAMYYSRWCAVKSSPGQSSPGRVIIRWRWKHFCFLKMIAVVALVKIEIFENRKHEDVRRSLWKHWSESRRNAVLITINSFKNRRWPLTRLCNSRYLFLLFGCCCFSLVRGVQYVHWVMHKCIMVKAEGKRNTHKVCKKQVNFSKTGGEILESSGRNNNFRETEGEMY